MKGFLAVAAGFVVLLPMLAFGQQRGIELKSVAEVEVVQKNAAGKTEVKRVEADKAKVTPGEVVIFTTTYTNKADKPAKNVVIINPVPEHMTYVDMSASGRSARIDFSVDGGKTYGDPRTLKVTDKNGKIRLALPADFTHIRWTVTAPLAPGASGSVVFKARVR
jgi:uncharacterized repeat protein (TIGR01451 family)